MAILADLFVGLTARYMLLSRGVEMFLWTSPKVYERVGFGFDQR